MKTNSYRRNQTLFLPAPAGLQISKLPFSRGFLHTPGLYAFQYQTGKIAGSFGGDQPPPFSFVTLCSCLDKSSGFQVLGGCSFPACIHRLNWVR